jgi:hypothetical protein
VTIRDRVEGLLRAWDQYETSRGAPPVIDYDCHPTTDDVPRASDRVSVYLELTALREEAQTAGEEPLVVRIGAHLAYLSALMGERWPLDEYVQATQGCRAAGWPEDYVIARGDEARKCLDGLGIGWGPDLDKDLRELEGPLDAEAAPDAIREAATDLEPAVRQLVGTSATYVLDIEATKVDAYWAYWLDGAGERVRLRLNLKNAAFTRVRARQFALHEVLGHGLQSASLADRCQREDVPWVRLLSVHAPHQVLLEGLAQALPLFATPQDESLIVRVRLDHYLQLVRAELHLGVNSGASVSDCAEHARSRVPFWTDEVISDLLADRGTDPMLRSYLWAYPAGLDWFVSLAEAHDKAIQEVLHAAYRAPLTPADLAALWPQGPLIGGPGQPVRLRKSPLS